MAKNVHDLNSVSSMVVLVFPEVDRHRRVRTRAHELARQARVLDVLAVRVENLHVHAERLALDLCGNVRRWVYAGDEGEAHLRSMLAAPGRP